MNTKLWKSALALSVCFGVVQTANAKNGEVVGGAVESGAASKEYVTLRLNLKPGSNYRITQNLRSTNTNVIAAKGKQRSFKITSEYNTNSVLKLSFVRLNADGTIQIRLVYLSLYRDWVVIMKNNRQTFPNFNKSPLVGQPLGMSVSPNGTIFNVRGWDKVLDKMPPSDLTPDNPKQTRQQKRAQIKARMIDFHVRDLLRQLFIKWPENSISSGFSWTQDTGFGPQSPLYHLKYTFERRANGSSIIAQTGTWKFESPNKPPIGGTVSGRITLDEKTGFPKTAQQNSYFFKQNSSPEKEQEADENKSSQRTYNLNTIKLTVEKVP